LFSFLFKIGHGKTALSYQPTAFSLMDSLPAGFFRSLCEKQLLAFTAVSQLLHTGAATAKWLFHQEKATSENAGKCTLIVKPL